MSAVADAKRVLADDAGLAACAAALSAGGLAIVPTDTVYGIAARADDPAALRRLYEAKGRDGGKPIALIAADAEAAEKYIGSAAAAFGSRHWPGALTVVANGEGVRVPDHGWMRRLAAACGGALRVTSANSSGEPPALDCASATAALGRFAAVAADGGASPGGTASTVVKVADDGTLELLRDGPVAFTTLASGSPRRAKILRSLDVDFFVEKTDAPETVMPDDPERTVRENALSKGAAAKAKRNVLSADTIVWRDGKIYGKPRDLDEARRFLRELSGRTHTVFTGVAYDGRTEVVSSEVLFRELTRSDIDAYVERVRPLDRAGAYDIDESGGFVVAGWNGSYENIMGLPVEPLKKWGIAK